MVSTTVSWKGLQTKEICNKDGTVCEGYKLHGFYTDEIDKHGKGSIKVDTMLEWYSEMPKQSPEN